MICAVARRLLSVSSDGYTSLRTIFPESGSQSVVVKYALVPSPLRTLIRSSTRFPVTTESTEICVPGATG